MTTTSKRKDMPLSQLEPRITLLEKGQEALQKDLTRLTHIVEEQAHNMLKFNDSVNHAISIMGEKITKENNAILSRINDDRLADTKTDWQTIWTFIGVLLVIVGALFTPIWIVKTNLESYVQNNSQQIKEINTLILEATKERAYTSATLEKNIQDIQEIKHYAIYSNKN